MLLIEEHISLNFLSLSDSSSLVKPLFKKAFYNVNSRVLRYSFISPLYSICYNQACLWTQSLTSRKSSPLTGTWDLEHYRAQVQATLKYKTDWSQMLSKCFGKKNANIYITSKMVTVMIQTRDPTCVLFRYYFLWSVRTQTKAGGRQRHRRVFGLGSLFVSLVVPLRLRQRALL